MGELDGAWDVVRVSGALPPLYGVRKRIDGDRGSTTFGPLRAPFEVRGRSLHYRFPFRGLVDVLEPEGDGYLGRAVFLGRELGRFRLHRATTTGGGTR